MNEASKPNGRRVSDSLDSGVKLPRPNWHLTTEKCSRLRHSSFHKTKADVVEFTYKQQNKTPEQGRHGEGLWLDHANKNKTIKARCQSLDGQPNIDFERTTRPTQQQTHWW